MAKAQDSPRAHVGDLVIVEGHRIGEARRIGEILEVLGQAGHEHYRVRWNDGHETDIRPAGGSARITPAIQTKRRKGT